MSPAFRALGSRSPRRWSGETGRVRQTGRSGREVSYGIVGGTPTGAMTCRRWPGCHSHLRSKRDPRPRRRQCVSVYFTAIDRGHQGYGQKRETRKPTSSNPESKRGHDGEEADRAHQHDVFGWLASGETPMVDRDHAR